MTDTAQLSTSEGPAPIPAVAFAGMAVLELTMADIYVALATFVPSLAVLWCAISGIVPISVAMLLHLEVLGIPAVFLLKRVRVKGDLSIPTLLLVATAASGPIGAAGCAGAAFALWYQRPSPRRLQDWYDYISGAVERGQLTQMHGMLTAGRLPLDAGAEVPRFSPILAGSSIDDQQRVLGVVGRRYHDDFRAILKRALRNRNGLIRAQAAAIASRLGHEEKTRLWASETQPSHTSRAVNHGLRLIERTEP
jgi:hypothetical protein